MKAESRPTAEDLLALAVHAAKRGGMHALTNRHRRTEIHEALAHDVKLKLDLECQQIIEQEILAAYPDHRILGEEQTGSEHEGSAAYEWIIDPIDGTVNFSHGLPTWCCSVAVRNGDTVLAGAVYAPLLDLLYTATLESNALCNGQPIRVSEIAEVGRAVAMTGADKEEASSDAPFRFFHAIAEIVQRPRISGSAAIDICQIAEGNADAYFEPRIYLWDTAAAGLILERAGGKCEPMLQRSGHSMAFLASNGKVHAALRKQLYPLLQNL